MSDSLDQWLPRLLSLPPSAINDKVWEWASPIDRVKFKRWHARLERVIAWKSSRTGKKALADRGRKSATVGKVYEKLLRILFESGGALSVVRNIRTTTNEIDLLLKVEPVALSLPVFAQAGTHIIGEAKCHAKPPSTELVNEFVGFLQVQNARFGVLFVFPKSQILNGACRVAIAMHWKDGFYIVPMGRRQLDEVLSGTPFLKVLRDQHIDAKNHVTKLAI